MYRTRLTRLVGSAVYAAAAIAAIALTPSAQADSPEKVHRVFAFFYAVDGDDNVSDYESDDSLQVISLAQNPSTVRLFATDEVNGPFSGIAMVNGEGTHVRIGGAVNDEFWWLFDPATSSWHEALPPVGARATTGPDGDVTMIGWYYVKSDIETGEWTLHPSALGAHARMCVAEGCFSK